MSTSVKQAMPQRCYCRVQDEGTSLNEIAKIINGLNLKILRLRNEVSALKHVNADGEEKLFKKVELTCRRSRSPNFPPCNLECAKFTISKESQALANFFENHPTKNFTSKSEETDDTYDSISKEKSQLTTDRKPLFENQLEKKKISQGIQCNLKMDRKRKRIFLNCFKTDNFLKPNKKMKFSLKTEGVHVPLDFEEEVNLPCAKEQDNGILELQAYVHGEGHAAQEKVRQTYKLIDDNEHEVDLSKDTEDQNRHFEYSIGRMGGGAEIRGNRLISDFHDKIQKINLYKHVKFDAKNVKKRLDACINQLNGIIDDVSLIFPNEDISKDLKK